MKSIRLTQYDRKDIARKVLTYRFNEKENKIVPLVAKAKHLVLNIYHDGLGKANLKKMEAIPKGWLPETSHLQVSFPGDKYAWLYFNGQDMVNRALPYESRFLHDEALVDVVFPIPADRKGCFAKYDADHNFTSRYNELVKEAEAMCEELQKARTTVLTALNSARTSKGLLEMWPEIEPFLIDRFGEEKVVKALAVPTPQLNKLFELPKAA